MIERKPPSVSQNLVGTTLKKQYFLRALAGRGAIAEVYLGWDNLRHTKMAIKVLRRDLASNWTFYQLFENEALRLSELQHPNIVRLYEFGRDGSTVFIAMAWVDGGNLRQKIDELGRPFSPEEVGHVLQPICAALNFAHQNQKPVYHCDIKPSNIMLHENGQEVYLADFSVARLASERGGGGTPPYMAPEQFAQHVDAKTDIYSLGVTVYEMLSGGKLPYHGDVTSPGTTTRAKYEWEHRNLPLPPLRQYNASLSQPVLNAVNKALEKDPGRRFATALDFWETFERARKTAGPAAKPEPPTVFDQAPKPLPESQESSTVVRHPKPPSQPAAPNFSVKPGLAYLYVKSGELAGQSIALVGSAVKIGRGASCQIHLHERSVSRDHATIIVTKRGVYLRDDGSSLGTILNGGRIPSNTPVALRHGDVVQIGYHEAFEFRNR